jgi:NDP-sugar pyrophosphorylase family protein
MPISDLYPRLITSLQGNPLQGTAAVILAAGSGRRLSPLTRSTPKPLLPVLNVPILLWKTARLKQAGIKEVCANIHYLREAFKDVEVTCETYGPRLRLVFEERLTGPLGGAISCREKIWNSEVCLIISGDSLEDIDLLRLVAAHHRSGAGLTMTATCIHNASRYGVLDIDSEGFVTRMREKPSEVIPSAIVSCGIYVMSTRLLLQLAMPKTGLIDFVDQVSTMLLSGEPVFTYAIDSWIDIGTPDDLLNANLTYLNSINLGLVASLHKGGSTGELWVQDAAQYPAETQIEGRVLLGAKTIIESNVKLKNSVIGDRAIIKCGATVTNSVLLPNAVIDAARHVTNEVVASS